MRIVAEVTNSQNQHSIILRTNNVAQSITIPPKASGLGSSVNGGELLFLALATCYCNDIYREAAKRNLNVKRVEITVEGDFTAEGEPAKNVIYRAKILSNSNAEAIRQLMIDTDRIAEIQNTLRVTTPVFLQSIEVSSE
jgi:uncharacterized OsmC-like protein